MTLKATRLKYVKLAKFVVVHVIGSVEDERYFSSLSFFKNKLFNSLDEHLPLVVDIYPQKFSTLQDFSFNNTFDMWMGSAKRVRYNL